MSWMERITDNHIEGYFYPNGQFVFENFTACNIDLAKRQLFVEERVKG